MGELFEQAPILTSSFCFVLQVLQLRLLLDLKLHVEHDADVLEKRLVHLARVKHLLHALLVSEKVRLIQLRVLRLLAAALNLAAVHLDYYYLMSAEIQRY